MITSVQLDGLTLIARGGQADIYDFGDGKILRVGRRPQDLERIRYEYTVYLALNETKIHVPKVYGLVEAAGMPAIVMERLNGPSMMDQIKANPLSAKVKARQLAGIHLEIGRINAPEQITDVKSRAEFCISKSEFVSESEKRRILEVLKKLPEGINLCHGDFHPGNLMVQQGTNYVIDWSAAWSGDFHSDVAHSFILMRVVPKVPDMSPLMHFLQKRIGRAIANTYLIAIENEVDIDHKTLSRWMLVNAAERTYFGVQSERQDLLAFIGKYLKVLKNGGEETNLYQEI